MNTHPIHIHMDVRIEVCMVNSAQWRRYYGGASHCARAVFCARSVEICARARTCERSQTGFVPLSEVAKISHTVGLAVVCWSVNDCVVLCVDARAKHLN